MNIPVVYEDDWLLVVDKPAGLLTIPTAKRESRTLTSILNEDLEERGLVYRLHPCHRLDRETSGLIIYAKGKAAQKKVMDEFRARRVKKSYIAFVRGSLNHNQGEIRIPIEGAGAVTRFKVIGRNKYFTIVEVYPLTGRTNQIRIHFKHIGHPILGESRYSFRRDFKLKAKRLCLHARTLEFMHPISKRQVCLVRDLPEGLKKLLDNQG